MSGGMERAAIAREVLTDMLCGMGAEAWDGVRVIKYIDKHYPAPPAPVTVTVNGVKWARLPAGSGWGVADDGMQPNKSDAWEFLDRIAADARRIAELEQERDTALATSGYGYRSDKPWTIVEAVADLVRERDALLDERTLYRQERDEARRALEAAQSRATAPLAPDPLVAGGATSHPPTGAETGPTEAEEPTAATVAPSCRDVATVTAWNSVPPHFAIWRFSPVKGEAGATVAASEPLASESPAATSPSPAPIPLGAVVEVANHPWSPFTRRDGGWFDRDEDFWGDSGSAGMFVTAIYRARHPVATRETVERVARAIYTADGGCGIPEVHKMYLPQARAALTAAGFTIQEGA